MLKKNSSNTGGTENSLLHICNIFYVPRASSATWCFCSEDEIKELQFHIYTEVTKERLRAEIESLKHISKGYENTAEIIIAKNSDPIRKLLKVFNRQRRGQKTFGVGFGGWISGVSIDCGRIFMHFSFYSFYNMQEQFDLWVELLYLLDKVPRQNSGLVCERKWINNYLGISENCRVHCKKPG